MLLIGLTIQNKLFAHLIRFRNIIIQIHYHYWYRKNESSGIIISVDISGFFGAETVGLRYCNLIYSHLAFLHHLFSRSVLFRDSLTTNVTSILEWPKSLKNIHLYMDDLLTKANTIEVCKIRNEIIAVLHDLHNVWEGHSHRKWIVFLILISS